MKKINYALAASVGALLACENSIAAQNALGTVPAVTAYVSGSTAQKTNFGNAMVAICQPGTLETYTNLSGGDRYITYYCQSLGVSGIQDGTNIMVRYSSYSTVVGNTTFPAGASAGGSILGANPVINQSKINFMAVSPATAALCNPQSVCDDTKPGLVVPYASQMGITDLHPKWFVLQNAPAEAGATITSALSKLKITPGVVTTFNTPVSLNLRDALQNSQIAAGKLDASCNASGVNRELGACTPSLTSDAISNIWSGAYTTWDKVDPALGAKPVKVVRREIGSGTQATMDIALGSKSFQDMTKAYPCAPGAQPGILNSANVVAASTGSEVETALVNFNKSGDYAIGISNANKNGQGLNAAGIKDYRMINIDGLSPTMNNVASGKYKLISQGTFQRLQNGAGTASEVAIVDALINKMTDPTIMKIGNDGSASQLNTGPAGVMTVTSGASCSDTNTCSTYPVTNVRFAKNAADVPDNCHVPTSAW